jgi:transposase
MKNFDSLSDLQWEQFSHLFPAPQKRRRGKPHAPWRAVLNSILYVLTTKTKWGSWPKTADFASKSVAHRWYLHWDKNGLLNQILEIAKHSGYEIASPQRRTHAPLDITSHVESLEEMPLYLPLNTGTEITQSK